MTFDQSLYHGSYTDFGSGETVKLDADTTMNLPAWSYRVFASESRA